MKNAREKNVSMKKFLMLTLLGVIALVLAACGGSDEESEANAEGSDEAATDEEITVAVVQDYPPFEYKVDEELTGFDIELVEAVAAEAGLTVNWNIMKFDGIIPALQANQVDAAVSAIGIRDDRLEVVDFSDPYFESGLSLITLNDSDINEEADLDGKTIVAKQGTASLDLANQLAEEYDIEVTTLQDDATMYMEVENGNADAVINDYPSIAYKINQDGDDSNFRLVGDMYPSEDYGIAISKGSEGLVDKLNEGLQAIRDSGEFDEIFNTYFSEE